MVAMVLTPVLMSAVLLITVAGALADGPAVSPGPDLDTRVSRFLGGARNTWSDWNVPYEDGKVLYDFVLGRGFRNILEIGTSTGHSTIWLAWAAAKTGGKVTTIEIDKGRYEEALSNFRKAGLTAYIDARLGDAHDLVRLLRGPWDFVFCDADKEWYLQYFPDIRPKIEEGGCFAAHNVLRSGGADVRRFLDHVRKDREFSTSVVRGSGEGLAFSCRVAR